MGYMEACNLCFFVVFICLEMLTNTKSLDLMLKLIFKLPVSSETIDANRCI